MTVSLALPAVFCLSDLLMASLFLTFIGECRLGFTPVDDVEIQIAVGGHVRQDRVLHRVVSVVLN